MPLRQHAKQMLMNRAGLDREVARELLLLGAEGSLTALVIYDTDGEILVFEIEPDSTTLSLLMQCQNKYAGDKSQPLPAHITKFITSFPTVYEKQVVMDNTDHESKWHAIQRPISYLFLMGCM